MKKEIKLVPTRLPQGARFLHECGLSSSVEALRDKARHHVNHIEGVRIVSAELIGLQYYVNGQRNASYEVNLDKKYVAFYMPFLVDEVTLQQETPRPNWIRKIINKFTSCK